MEVAKRVRAARAYGDFARAEDLAKAIGIGRTTLLKIEKGDRAPKRWELIAIAEICGLPREFFTAEWANVDWRVDRNGDGSM